MGKKEQENCSIGGGKPSPYSIVFNGMTTPHKIERAYRSREKLHHHCRNRKHNKCRLDEAQNAFCFTRVGYPCSSASQSQSTHCGEMYESREGILPTHNSPE